MRSSTAHQIVIALAAGLVFFTNLGATHLWDDDETYYASIARTMLDQGDWVVPNFNGKLFPEKPPLVYWSILGGFELFGRTEFGARFFSALCGVATALVTYRLGRWLYNPRVGFWGGLITASTIIFTVSARAATIDAAIALAANSALLAFVGGGIWLRRRTATTANATTGAAATVIDVNCLLNRPWWSYAAVYGCLGVAVLAKGPIGFLLPALGLGLFLLVANRWTVAASAPGSFTWTGMLRSAGRALGRWLAPGNILRSMWQMRPLTAILMILLVAGPWFVLVGLRTHGEFLESFFGKFNLRPFMQPILGHQGPIFYYIPAILIGFFPWSVFLGAMVTALVGRLRRKDAWAVADTLLLCQVTACVGFWSICSTKLPHYMVPIYPPLALLTATWIDRWLAAPASDRKSPRQMALIVMVVGAGIMIALPIVSHFVLPGEGLLGLIGAVLVAGGGACWWYARRQQSERFLAAFAVTSVALLVAMFGLGAVRVDRHQNAPRLAAAIAADAGHEAPVAAYKLFRPSMVYYTQQTVPFFWDLRQLKDYLVQSPGAYLFTTEKHLAELETQLPGQFRVVRREPRFLQRGELLVVGPADCPAARQADRIQATTSR